LSLSDVFHKIRTFSISLGANVTKPGEYVTVLSMGGTLIALKLQ
jgi:hypothetical protein